MKFDSRNALTKFAKAVAQSSQIYQEMRNFGPLLEKEFAVELNNELSDKWEHLLNQVREKWEFPEGGDLIELGPFSYRVHDEKYMSIPGCSKMKPTSTFDYNFVIQFGPNVIAQLEEIKKFYETTTYVERYQMLFGFTNAAKNATQAMADFTNFYIPNHKCVGENETEEE